MKNIICILSGYKVSSRIRTILICVSLLGGYSLIAGEAAPAGKSTVEPAVEDEPFQNWVNLSLGGLILGGDEAQFKQANHNSSTVNGGIEDLHYEKSLGKKTRLTIDGHAIIDNTDYKVKLTPTQQDLGYISAGYTLFRTWYDGNGGYFPGNGAYFPPAYGNELALDRGDAWIELGLRIPNLPELTLRYDHLYRYGQKDSTSWGDTGLTGLPGSSGRRNIVPSFRDINEKRDVVTFEATHTVFGNTDLNAGMRFEYTNNEDSLNVLRRPNESSAQRSVTQVDSLQSDLFNGHFSSTTRFNDMIWFTAGYSYTTMNSDIGGNRIYGPSFSSTFDPTYAHRQNFDEGFYNLAGGSRYGQNVVNLNVLYTPFKDLTIIPAVRISTEGVNSQSTFVETVVQSGSMSQTPMFDKSSSYYLNLNESIDIRYTGISNVLFYFRGDWAENNGNRQWITNNLDDPAGNPQDNENQDINYLSQKYAIGANWYPFHQLNLSAQYYHKIEGYDYAQSQAIGILKYQSFNTDDFNIRVTWRPLASLSLVSRYDMQYVNMYNQSVDLANNQSAKISNNIITECVTWSPLARLYLQGNASLVFNETTTGAKYNLGTNSGPTVLNGMNNYVTLGCAVGFVIDDKTNLNAAYSYYHATDYQNNAQWGMPYGAGAIENTITVGITRKLTKNISMSLNYSYYAYSDQTSGYHNNYTANAIYSGLQFQF